MIGWSLRVYVQLQKDSFLYRYKVEENVGDSTMLWLYHDPSIRLTFFPTTTTTYSIYLCLFQYPLTYIHIFFFLHSKSASQHTKSCGSRSHCVEDIR
jgi:hypothetical protein